MRTTLLGALAALSLLLTTIPASAAPLPALPPLPDGTVDALVQGSTDDAMQDVRDAGALTLDTSGKVFGEGVDLAMQVEALSEALRAQADSTGRDARGTAGDLAGFIIAQGADGEVQVQALSADAAGRLLDVLGSGVGLAQRSVDRGADLVEAADAPLGPALLATAQALPVVQAPLHIVFLIDTSAVFDTLELGPSLLLFLQGPDAPALEAALLADGDSLVAALPPMLAPETAYGAQLAGAAGAFAEGTEADGVGTSLVVIEILAH
jgi:hypothetical protein